MSQNVQFVAVVYSNFISYSLIPQCSKGKDTTAVSGIGLKEGLNSVQHFFFRKLTTFGICFDVLI